MHLTDRMTKQFRFNSGWSFLGKFESDRGIVFDRRRLLNLPPSGMAFLPHFFLAPFIPSLISILLTCSLEPLCLAFGICVGSPQ